VGLGLASCLLAAGETLHLHGRRRDATDALRRLGLSRSGIFGCHEAPPGSFSASSSSDDLVSFAPDVLLVCIKAPDLDRAAEELARTWPQLPGAPPLVLCVNGWGAAQRVARGVPEGRIFNATVTTGFHRDGDAGVEVTVHGDELHVGSLYGTPTDELAPLCAALTRGGLPSALAADMEAQLWAKLLYNCALNPLAALLGVPYGALAENPASRQVLEAVVEEIFAVLQASGRRTRWPSAASYLAFFFAELLPPTRAHESSMLQDLRAGRPTEIDALSGAIVELGREAGAPTPVNAALATLIRALQPPRVARRESPA
jgi:2-dehydropantoate 2-reductase